MPVHSPSLVHLILSLHFLFLFSSTRYLLTQLSADTVPAYLGGVISIHLAIMQWYLQNALTQGLSQESKFETFIIMCPAINGIVFSLGNTNLCYFENISSSSGVGQDEVMVVEEMYLNLGIEDDQPFLHRLKSHSVALLNIGR